MHQHSLGLTPRFVLAYNIRTTHWLLDFVPQKLADVRQKLVTALGSITFSGRSISLRASCTYAILLRVAAAN